jgi:hypothetical protein
MKKDIHPAIEEIHETRRKIFRKFKSNPHEYGKHLMEISAQKRLGKPRSHKRIAASAA